MRKNVLFLVAVALSAMTIITSCGKKEDSYACEQSQMLGTYNGSHNLTINSPVQLTVPINDKITVTAIAGTTDSVLITSQTLGVTLKGVVKDCKVSVPTTHIDEFTYDLGGMIKRVKISNVNASLTARKNTTKGQVESVIHVESGTANTLDNELLKDLSIANTELPGLFK